MITGPDAKKAVAEMVAALYDQSLDAYLPHNWPQRLQRLPPPTTRTSNPQFENAAQQLAALLGQLADRITQDATLTYRAFPPTSSPTCGAAATASAAAALDGGAAWLRLAMAHRRPPSRWRTPPMAGGRCAGSSRRRRQRSGDGMATGERQPRRRPAPARPAGRRRPRPEQGLGPQEPQRDGLLLPAPDRRREGKVKLEFTMPEALTQWKFLGFAHDAELRGGLLAGQGGHGQGPDGPAQSAAVPPRRRRAGVHRQGTNQSAARQTGTVRLTLADARTGQAGRRRLGNTATDQAFDIPAKESRSFAWRLTVPDGLGRSDLQGGGRDRPALRRRGRAAAGALAGASW